MLAPIGASPVKHNQEKRHEKTKQGATASWKAAVTTASSLDPDSSVAHE